jgi:exopolyphosphatase / guanosine-5'-triphosphate,3'-diphosphate pyrophosphatase
MKCASIDVGTNTVLLLIVEIEGGIKDFLELSTITRLGEGLKERGHLSVEAMDRTFKALEHYMFLMREHGVEEVLCVGTSALREAKNAAMFLERVQLGLQVSVKVITEYDEAFYTYLSVKHDLGENANKPFIIVDIGGGSTEIIKGCNRKFVDFVSLPTGSVKLTEMFIRHDPPLNREIEDMKDFITELLDIPFDGDGGIMVGCGGTVTNIASIKLGKSYEKEKLHGLTMSKQAIQDIVEKLGRASNSDRRLLKGMERGREDIILQGAILLRQIMAHFNARELTVNANGVRHGVIHEKYGQLHSL